MIMFKKPIKKEESGVASFIVTFVICIVITLIVVGFGTIARREQRQALDEQLSSQAFYAAESKINQLAAKLQADPASFAADNSCDPTADSSNLNLPSGVTVTCALASSSGSLVYNLSPDQSVTVPVDGTGQTYATISLSWLSDGANQCTNSYALPSGSSYPANRTGMIRFMMTRADGSAGYEFNRDAVASNTLSAVLVPYFNASDPNPNTISAYYYKPGGTNPYPWIHPHGNSFPSFQTSDYFEDLGTGPFGTGRPGVGYSYSEYNRFQKQVAAGKKKTDFAAPNYGPTTPSSDAARVDWTPFWNWLDYYRQATSSTSVPVAYVEGGWTFPPPFYFPTYKDEVSGNYKQGSATNPDKRLYFKEWATSILTASPVGSAQFTGDARPYFLNNDPDDKYLYESQGSRTNYPLDPSVKGKPIYIGGCNSATGRGYANIVFPTPISNAKFQLTFHNLYKNSTLTITGYKPDGSTADLTPATGGTGGQVTLDVTAKAQDIVRRLQVHVSYGQASGTLNFPAQALRTSNSVCKVLKTSPTSTVEDTCP